MFQPDRLVTVPDGRDWVAAAAHAVHGLGNGALLGIDVPAPKADSVRLWSEMTGHPVVGEEQASGRATFVVRKGSLAREEVDLHARLWIYTNLNCNLACDYCCVRSSPTVAPRMIDPETVDRLARDAARLGFGTLFLTGGEPLLHPRIDELVHAGMRHLPVTLLTNAMLFRGRRREVLERMPRDVTLQISLDSPEPTTHDAHRGKGSWQAAWEGIQLARELGFRVRVAATLPTEEERQRMDDWLKVEGFADEDRLIRPLARLGEAEERDDAQALRRADVLPEVAYTAEGVFWHPVGAATPGFRVLGPEASLDEALQRVREMQHGDAEVQTRVADIFHCA